MSFIATIQSLLQQSLNQLLPSICFLCAAPLLPTESGCCNACLRNLPQLPADSCKRCGSFLYHSGVARTNAERMLLCGQCLTNPPSYEATFALYPYAPPISQCITALKFQQQLIFANFFATQLLWHIQTDWYKSDPAFPDMIVPVPLARERLRQRGFNQALEIAKPLAKALAIALNWQEIIRIKETVCQSGLNAKARKQNLHNAFGLSSQVDYRDRSIAIVDDVMTTGSTVESLAKLLKKNGAKSVHIWCCARRG